MALAVAERRREITMLRAIGLTRRQARSTVRWEAVGAATCGAVLAAAIPARRAVGALMMA
ncbi:MAG: putative ABC transport system permease protein [Ilumatobacter sp.]|jgi:putative ABC transport system permease protein